MANCPACGCPISIAARFCPMCGVTIREDAVNARQGSNAEITPVELPEPNDQIIRKYVGLNRCGAGIIRALRVLLLVISIVVALCGIAYGIMLLADGNTLHGVISLVLGPGIGMLLYVIMTIGIILYENISFIARHTETQNRIAAAQLELIRDLAAAQKENFALTGQAVELLKVMDGDRFDAAKLAERQTELLEKLSENQQEAELRLADIKDISERLVLSADTQTKSAQTWRDNTKQYAQAIAYALSQLPYRLRAALNGAQTEEVSDTQEADIPAEDSDGGATDFSADDQNP